MSWTKILPKNIIFGISFGIKKYVFLIQLKHFEMDRVTKNVQLQFEKNLFTNFAKENISKRRF